MDLLNHIFKDLELFLERELPAIVVKYSTWNVAELYDCDHFEHEVAANLVDDPLKEGLVVVQVEAQVELWLKDVPNRVVFSCLGWRTQLHLCPQPVVKSVRILPILAQCVHFEIAGLRAAL